MREGHIGLNSANNPWGWVQLGVFGALAMTIAKKNNNTTTVLELHTPPFALLSPLGLLGVVPVAAGAGVRWGEVLALCETAFWADEETHIFHQPLGATSTPPKTSPSHFFKTNQPITKPPPPPR